LAQYGRGYHRFVLLHFAYAAILVFGTVLIHVACTAGVIVWLRSLATHHWALRTSVRRAAVLGALVLVMSMVGLLESGLWAGFYLMVDALPTLEDAIYFSLVTFTTLGYGDITLDERWRVLAAFEAANGIIMFGWTTAIIAATAHHIFFDQRPGGDAS
jgi:voltage-gated potassium channel Kch